MSAPISTLPAAVAAPARGAKAGSSDGGAAFGSVFEGTVASQRSDQKPSARDQGPTKASASPTDRSESAAHGRPAAEQGAPAGLPVATGPGATLPTVDATDATDLATTPLADGIPADPSQTGAFDAAMLDFATARGADIPNGAAEETGSAAQDTAADALLLAADEGAVGGTTADTAARGGEVPATASAPAASAAPAAAAARATASTASATPDAAHTAEVPDSVGVGAKTPTDLGTPPSSAAGQGLQPPAATPADPAEGSQTALSDDQTQQLATLRTGGAASATAATAAIAEPAQTQAAALSPAAASAVPPAQAPASVAPTQPVTPPAPAAATTQTQAPTYATQVAGPVFSLASAGKGEHVMTVTVTPENLGPVTVRAVVGAESVRVELFAPTDAGRDALRALMPDLRRDLAATGMSASLDLSSDNAPADRGEGAPGREHATGEQPSATSAGRTADSVPSRPAPVMFGGAPTIDVMA